MTYTEIIENGLWTGYQLLKNLALWLTLPAGILEERDIKPQIALKRKQEVMQQLTKVQSIQESGLLLEMKNPLVKSLMESHSSTIIHPNIGTGNYVKADQRLKQNLPGPLSLLCMLHHSLQLFKMVLEVLSTNYLID